jgi:large subunit ribosomal protein L25
MKSITINGHKREGLGKTAAGQARATGFVPCELYGKSGNFHFSVFVNDFKPLVYTPEKFRVDLNIEGKTYQAIMREVQFHPLSDEILHVDFNEIDEDKIVKMELPIKLTGVAAGVREGGKLIQKLRTLKIKGLPKDMPDAIEVDVTSVGMGKSVKVKDINAGNLEIMNPPTIPVASVEVPRGLKGKEGEEASATPAAAAAAK